MTIANDIISHRMPDFELYLRAGESLDDIDEYGFTPLIECAITRQPKIAQELLARQVDVNKPDAAGRTPLHWAVDNNDMEMAHLLLTHGADANAYAQNGLSVLVYPVLRNQNALKHLLYQYGAKLDFAMDFIYGKLLGHRFELRGDVDIVNAQGEFIELDYEGFILEFTIATVKDALRRFISSYSARHLRDFFPFAYLLTDAFEDAAELLQYQHQQVLRAEHLKRLQELLKAPMLILPAASRGHAICFIRFGSLWAKIDRGENSLKEGSANIYKITRPEMFDVDFLRDFLYKKHSRSYFHQAVNQQLGLIPVKKLPISAQISGNCSWANVQAVIPVAFAMQEPDSGKGIDFYNEWMEWDKDRALDEAMQRFYLVSAARKATIAAMLGGVLFQTCEHSNPQHLLRAEKILKILTLKDYEYILQSYLDEYCIKRLTRKGNNLLKILDDCGINPDIGVNPIATE